MSELIDKRARRISTLKEIIQHLHKGEAADAVRAQLRDKEGKYLGTVELRRDIAPLRPLTGERRLLQYN